MTDVPDYVPENARETWLTARDRYNVRREYLLGTGQLKYMLEFHEIPRQVQNDWIAYYADASMEHEGPDTAPRPMTGIFNTLTADQQQHVLDYDGPINHGDPAFSRKEIPKRYILVELADAKLLAQYAAATLDPALIRVVNRIGLETGADLPDIARQLMDTRTCMACDIEGQARWCCSIHTRKLGRRLRRLIERADAP